MTSQKTLLDLNKKMASSDVLQTIIMPVKPKLQLRDFTLKQRLGRKNAFIALCLAPHYVWA